MNLNSNYCVKCQVIQSITCINFNEKFYGNTSFTIHIIFETIHDHIFAFHVSKPIEEQIWNKDTHTQCK